MNATARCCCARHGDGSVTTSHCPLHADHDPCASMAAITGTRRTGTIRRGTCTACGWSATPARELPIPYPMPGDDLDGAKVIASVWYCEFDGRSEVTVLRLHPEAPYYSVDLAYLADGRIAPFGERLSNIVPAVALYEQSGGDW